MEVLVYLYKSPDCIRGWLSYLKPSSSSYTISIIVESETRQKAKNKAITCANNGFKNCKIQKIDYDHRLWGVKNFPELKKQLDGLKALKTLSDYDIWYKPCEHCGYDPGKTKKNSCWKCGRRIHRDYSERALKNKQG